jgi:uncharacterized membrane protein YidH (DUF202 family)
VALIGRGPPPQPPRDPGLQPERTALAWNRTGLALLLNALLALRLGLADGPPLMLALGGALVAGALATMAIGRRRRVQLLGDGRLDAAPVWMMRFTVLVALGAALTGLAGVVASRL